MATNSTNNQTVSISNSNTCKANKDVWSERCKIEPFNCRVVKSMVVALAAVAPRTPTDNAAVTKHDLKQISAPTAPTPASFDFMIVPFFERTTATAASVAFRVHLSIKFLF